MDSIYIKNWKKIIKNKKELESKLKLKISNKNNMIFVEGKDEDEFIGLKVLDAIDFGFNLNKALQLLDEDFVFEKINIKDFSNRKNLKEIRARIIGTQGKTLKTLEELSGCFLVLNENDVGIIAPGEELKNITHAVKSLIQGSKQSNVYSFLEKNQPEVLDLGLKKEVEE